MAGPSFSEWARGAGPLQVSQASFAALFDSRYPGRLNQAMREFLEAYARAVKETRLQDRFPNLQEVQKHLAEYEVYNLKKRFISKTGFFREVSAKPSGVILIPRGREFQAEGGVFSGLSFDFEAGAVVLPRILNPELFNQTLAQARTGERVVQELESTWEDWSGTPWKRVLAMERPILYILLLVMTGVNASLAVLVWYVFSRLGAGA